MQSSLNPASVPQTHTHNNYKFDFNGFFIRYYFTSKFMNGKFFYVHFHHASMAWQKAELNL